MTLISLLGCAEPLAPDLPVREDAMLGALPAEATLLAGFDLEAIRAIEGPPAFAPQLADLERWLLSQDLGPGTRFTRVRLGCADEGCIALGEGDFSELPEPPGLLIHRVGTGYDVGGLVVRRLDAGKIAAGDRAMVREVAEAATRGGPALQLESLQGRIPAGQAWLLAREPDRLVGQVTARLEREDAQLAEQIALEWADAPGLAREFDSLAVSVDVGQGKVWLRAVLRSEGAAIRALVAWKAWQMAHPEHVWADASAHRVGAVLEAQWTPEEGQP